MAHFAAALRPNGSFGIFCGSCFAASVSILSRSCLLWTRQVLQLLFCNFFQWHFASNEETDAVRSKLKMDFERSVLHIFQDQLLKDTFFGSQLVLHEFVIFPLLVCPLSLLLLTHLADSLGGAQAASGRRSFGGC